jgi:hypothetical protein
MDIVQKFSLGTLVAGGQSRAPTEVKLTVEGRGIFAHIAMEFTFSEDDSSVPRLFTVDRPWNAVLSKIAVNQESLDSESEDFQPRALPSNLRMAAEDLLQEGHSEAVCCFFEPGQSLRTLTLDFVMACDVLWHQSCLAFSCVTGSTSVQVDFNWDLSGLPGARLECAEAAADSRFSSLQGSLRNWTESINVKAGDTLAVALVLDEKKAASLCLYSNFQARGCGAVVVVAPVRPRLVRKPIRLAVVVEIRNPQEGLLARDLVDQLVGALNSQDQISIFFMGSSVTRNVLDWTEAANLSEGTLAKLLDPSLMGRTQYFWESLQRVLGECQGATHVLLSSPGPKEPAPESLTSSLPLFCFATGNKPNSSTLGEFVDRTGGFLSENSIDGVASFLQRLTIRLSPPLLRDFRLEGWGLEDLTPRGLTQVYTDKPTLVMGRYEGLLPQTVTLCGFSPSGQELGQRVRVESFSQFDLSPVFEQRSLTGEIVDHAVRKVWATDNCFFADVVRPVSLADLFVIEASEADAPNEPAPPSIDIVSAAVTLDDHAFGAPSDATIGDEFFGGGGAGQTLDDGYFSGSAAESNDADLFAGVPGSADGFLEEAEGSGGFFDQESASGDDFFATSIEDDDTPTFLSHEPNEEDDDGPMRLTLGSRASKSRDSSDSGELRPLTIKVDADEELDFPPVEESAEDSTGLQPPCIAEPNRASDVSAERATLAVINPIPPWARELATYDSDDLGAWLARCPIDSLALALVDTEENLARSFLQRIEPPRKTAVELQMELGRLLSADERLEASRQLEQRLQR